MTFSSDGRGWRLGAVSYLNARPLIEGLDAAPNIELIHEVPSRLAGLLDDGVVDAALVPVIDLVRRDRQWQIVSDACIGGDGETLTVRVFSRVAPQEIRTLHVDGDSHTSVVLATVIWREMYGRKLDIVRLGECRSIDECEAILLIGDKVVTARPSRHEIETDLGSAWKSMTSLPFVFAVWAAPRSADVGELAELLSNARDRGVQSAEMIAEDFGPGMGWPVTLAKRYLTTRIKFHLGPRQRQGLTEFVNLARKYSLVSPSRELVFA